LCTWIMKPVTTLFATFHLPSLLPLKVIQEHRKPPKSPV
jgi:hypothetical protein